MAARLSGDRGRVGVAVAFFGHAVVFGTWASRVPAVKHALGLSDAQLGLALFGMAAGTLLGSRLGGVLASRFGAWRVVRTGLPVLAAALVLAAGSAPFLARLPHRSTPLRPADAAGEWSAKLVVLGLIGFCSFFAEGAAADWSAVYLRDRADAGAAVAAAGFASFSLAMAASRLAGDRLATELG